jgi:hypothetical protein
LRVELDMEYDRDLERSIRNAEERLDRLIEGPHEPDRVVLRPVDPPTTVAEHWASLRTAKDINDYLRATMITFYADREGIIGQVGWIALDDPNITYTGMRNYLRRLKMPLVETWRDIAERLGNQP